MILASFGSCLATCKYGPTNPSGDKHAPSSRFRRLCARRKHKDHSPEGRNTTLTTVAATHLILLDVKHGVRMLNGVRRLPTSNTGPSACTTKRQHGPRVCSFGRPLAVDQYSRDAEARRQAIQVKISYAHCTCLLFVSAPDEPASRVSDAQCLTVQWPSSAQKQLTACIAEGLVLPTSRGRGKELRASIEECHGYQGTACP